MRVLLYAHYSPSDEVDVYVRRSIENIAANFHSIYVLTNVAGAVFDRENVSVVGVESRIDFESYIHFFARFPEVVAAASRLYLVNDSILIQKPVSVPSSSRIDVFGLSESHQSGSHIQSFFIGFHNRETIDMAVDYLRGFPGRFDDKQTVIDYCEVGLSRYLVQRRCRLSARLSAPANCADNPTLVFWHTLLSQVGILKRNLLLGTGDVGVCDVRLEEVCRACLDENWRRIATRLYVPRPGRPPVEDNTPGDDVQGLLDEVYGRILLRPCDSSGFETYSKFLETRSLTDLEVTLRRSDEYRVIQDLAKVFREVLRRYPDRHGLNTYRDTAREEGGLERVKDILCASKEYRHNLDGAGRFRDLCRNHACRFDGFRACLERDGSVEAVLIETRREEALRYVIPNTVSRLPRGWGLTIVHATHNASFVREICHGIDNVTFVCLPDTTDLSDFRCYNALLTDPVFWERFTCEQVLIFQWDCLLTGEGIAAFTDFDFIGAPWPDDRVGNGGFSLRRVRVMREISSRHVPGDFENEDEFFARHLYAGHYRLPDTETASGFCTEFREPSLAYHRPWLARNGVDLESLFHGNLDARRISSIGELPIPVLLVIDVEPDARLVERADRWWGFEDLSHYLSLQRSRLADATGRAVNYCWMLRLDEQIKTIYGHADWVVRTYRDLINKSRHLGDEFGLHAHAWRHRDGNWICDHGDTHWVARNIASSHSAFCRAMGHAPVTFTHGDRFMSNELMAQLESLGIRIDATLQPGRPQIAGQVVTELASGSLPDFSAVPRQPYRPSCADYRMASTDQARDMLEIPLSVSDQPTRGNGDNSALLLGRSFDSIRCVIEDNLAKPSPYLYAAMRTDVRLDAVGRRAFDQAIDYLATHPLRHRFVFETPSMLARRIDADTTIAVSGMAE